MVSCAVVGPTRTLVTLATYNEIDNLPRLVSEIFRYVPEADVLIIYDNSPDGTGDWCDEQAAADPRIRCLHRPCKQGLGSATIAGMRYALEHDYAAVLNLDADFSHHPRYLPELLAGVRQEGESAVDVMIGSRYVPGGGIVHDGKLMFDLHSFPLRIEEVADSPHDGVLKIGYLDSIFGRSKGGVTPSGWNCDSLPFMVELDNFGSSGREGENIGAHWIWGYDEIC